jgi:medium-chain acyl-[acyl-carrier-protein] hydrolase
MQKKLWFFPLTPERTSTKVRLFIFHHAGGSATAFRSFASALNVPVEIIAIQLPGRETRFTEKPYYNFHSLINNLIENFPTYHDKPFIFLGHSLGSIISFEFAHALKKNSLTFPLHLIISGTRAAHISWHRKRIHNLPDGEFIKELSYYNGIPKEILENKELISLFIPTIRADFTLSETYLYSSKIPLPCPITVLGGRDDPHASEKELSLWNLHTSNDFKQYMFKGDHFFLLKESILDVAKVVNQIITMEISKLIKGRNF